MRGPTCVFWASLTPLPSSRKLHYTLDVFIANFLTVSVWRG
jgi:hypothetical protein